MKERVIDPGIGLFMAALVIFTLGLVMIFSTTSAEVLDHTLSKGEHLQLIKQGGYALLGSLLGYGTYKMGWRRMLDKSPLFMNIIIVLLVLTLIPGIGKEVNGSRRWLSLAGFSFQPSEFAKIIVPSFFLFHYLKFQGCEFTLKDFLRLLARCLIPVFLIIIEPNNGTAMVITMALMVAFFLTGVPFKYWGLPLLIIGIAGGIFASQLPYVTKRLKVYLDPESDLKGKGHQPYQAKIATGSGGVWGVGPAKSLQKLSYLPEAQNDYIAAIYAEEFGFAGLLLLIALYMTVAMMGFLIASNAIDPAALALGGVITFLITFQAFLNLGVVSGLLPSTGLNLPLFSQGGTSLMANLVFLSLLYSIGRDKCQEFC